MASASRESEPALLANRDRAAVSSQNGGEGTRSASLRLIPGSKGSRSAAGSYDRTIRGELENRRIDISTWTASLEPGSVEASERGRHDMLDRFGVQSGRYDNDDDERGQHLYMTGRTYPLSTSHSATNTLLASYSSVRQADTYTSTTTRNAKSASSQNSIYSAPIVVRTYPSPSPSRRSPSQPRINKALFKMSKDFPPVEAFSFQGIMDSIHGSVADDLDRIAEICARSRYSLSNQYEVHMPPHGQGEAFLKPVGDGQDLIHRSGPAARRAGHMRSGRSKAFDTLETIYASSSSGASAEEIAKKRSAKELADQIKRRQSRKEMMRDLRVEESNNDADFEQSEMNGHGRRRTGAEGHRRKKSATLASIVIDNAKTTRSEAGSHQGSTTSSRLLSKPSQPSTTDSNLVGGSSLAYGKLSHRQTPQMSAGGYHFPSSLPVNSSQVPQHEEIPSASVLGTFSSWLPWLAHHEESSSAQPSTTDSLHRTHSARGSLKKLLEATEKGERKGKERRRDAG